MHWNKWKRKVVNVRGEMMEWRWESSHECPVRSAVYSAHPVLRLDPWLWEGHSEAHGISPYVASRLACSLVLQLMYIAWIQMWLHTCNPDYSSTAHSAVVVKARGVTMAMPGQLETLYDLIHCAAGFVSFKTPQDEWCADDGGRSCRGWLLMPSCVHGSLSCDFS